jgi:hypothetical protein
MRCCVATAGDETSIEIESSNANMLFDRNRKTMEGTNRLAILSKIVIQICSTSEGTVRKELGYTIGQ